MKSPFSEWSGASKIIKDHESKSDVHRTAIPLTRTFSLAMENKIKSIYEIQDKAFDRIVSVNRGKLKSIVNTAILCRQQNIPLMGHRDDSKYYNRKDCSTSQVKGVLKEYFEC